MNEMDECDRSLEVQRTPDNGVTPFKAFEIQF